MKKKIHPDYHRITVELTDGSKFDQIDSNLLFIVHAFNPDLFIQRLIHSFCG